MIKEPKFPIARLNSEKGHFTLPFHKNSSLITTLDTLKPIAN
jgi:hypothetical protein